MAVSVESLFQSYSAYLRAKIALEEFGSFGGIVADSARKAIADYEAVEAQWIEERIAIRREQAAVFAEKIEGKKRSTGR